jgi:hypothetical protein
LRSAAAHGDGRAVCHSPIGSAFHHIIFRVVDDHLRDALSSASDAQRLAAALEFLHRIR